MRSSPVRKQIASAVTATLFLMTLIFVFTSSAMAQATTGSLKGTVVDPNGNVVAGATVTAKSDATAKETSTVTTGDGLYSIGELIPGVYTVTIPAISGFSPKAETGVIIKLGEVTNL